MSRRQRAEQQPLRGEPRAQGGVRGALAQRHPGVLHHLPAAVPAAQRQGGCKYTVNIVLSTVCTGREQAALWQQGAEQQLTQVFTCCTQVIV